ncbi:MAG: hypothetical protein ACP5FY_11235 [Kosmotogaceae bacterium]
MSGTTYSSKVILKAIQNTTKR